MTSSPPLIPARYYARLAEVLPSIGVDLDAAIKESGLSVMTLIEPGSMLTIVEIERLVAAVENNTEQSDLALHFGRALNLSLHSTVGYGILSSPTIDYGLGLAARFFSLIHPAYRLRYALNETCGVLEFTQLVDMSPSCRALHVESVAVAALWELRELNGGQVSGVRIEIALPPPLHIDSYASLGDNPVVFDPSFTCDVSLRVPRRMLLKPPIMADTEALKLAERRCTEMLNDAMSDEQLSTWVVRMLNAADGGLPRMHDLAHTLNLSPRTFERHLKAESTSYRKLANQVLADQAKDLLSKTDKSITAIAFELGYSDSANFTRAFKSHTGQNPSQFRQSMAKSSVTAS
jgi:AraC-like DNA-binding protein